MVLYQGDFLPEDPYAPWAEMKRLALKDEYIATAMMMATIYQEQDQWEAAAQCCRSALAADSCLEQAGAMLMEILARQERRSDAVKVYEQLRAALEHDLGVEPDPAIAAIYRRIRKSTARNQGP
jgi:DNA-binding SARP family transcriptional activator